MLHKLLHPLHSYQQHPATSTSSNESIAAKEPTSTDVPTVRADVVVIEVSSFQAESGMDLIEVCSLSMLCLYMCCICRMEQVMMMMMRCCHT